MSEKFIRTYQALDVAAIKKNLLVYGDLGGQCGACGEVDIKLSQPQCPKCQAGFKYVSFRNAKHHLPKMGKLKEEHPTVVFIDHDDYARALSEQKAHDFLK